MNNQIFHITNHWALEKKPQRPQGSSLLWWQFWYKPIFAGSPVFTMEKTGFFSTCQLSS